MSSFWSGTLCICFSTQKKIHTPFLLHCIQSWSCCTHCSEVCLSVPFTYSNILQLVWQNICITLRTDRQPAKQPVILLVSHHLKSLRLEVEEDEDEVAVCSLNNTLTLFSNSLCLFSHTKDIRVGTQGVWLFKVTSAASCKLSVMLLLVDPPCVVYE